MREESWFLIYCVAAVGGWAVFYYTVKAAVKWGIIEGKEVTDFQEKISTERTFKELAETPQRKELQKRYDDGKISFEVYKTEWNKT